MQRTIDNPGRTANTANTTVKRGPNTEINVGAVNASADSVVDGLLTLRPNTELDSGTVPLIQAMKDDDLAFSDFGSPLVLGWDPSGGGEVSWTINGVNVVQIGTFSGTHIGDGSQLTNISPSQLFGTVPVSKGGTGQASFTANQVLLGNGTNPVNSSANLTFNGLTFAITGGMTASGVVSISRGSGSTSPQTQAIVSSGSFGGGFAFNDTNWAGFCSHNFGGNIFFYCGQAGNALLGTIALAPALDIGDQLLTVKGRGAFGSTIQPGTINTGTTAGTGNGQLCIDSTSGHLMRWNSSGLTWTDLG